MEDPWMHHMRRGDFESAWRISDASMIHRLAPDEWRKPRHEQRIWDGAPLGGRRVLVRCYHGLGDTLQFIRYAAPLRAITEAVIVWAQPALIPLLRTAPGIDRLERLHDGTPEIDYDADVEVMELPHVFRSTLQTLPCQVPYVRAPRLELPPSPKVRIGVVWSAGGWDARRSIPAADLRLLAEHPGVEWHILQQGAARENWPGEIAALPDDSVLATASRMAAMDLVITVDSFPAHLAGALGVPVWTLLHSSPDWRWMLERDDSPWYPTMRLFRQTSAGNWAEVIGRVRGELERLTIGRPSLSRGSKPAPE